MRNTRAEQETILRWDDEEQIVSLYSASPKTWRKAARMGLLPTKETAFTTGEPSGKFYRFPLVELLWRRRAPKPPSEAQRRAVATATQAARARRSP